MADRTQLKIADRDSFSSEDPFAELTRIMGFDPREPARQPEPASADNVADDDFGIDLEKELMGEFGLGESAQAEFLAYAPAEQAAHHAEPAFEHTAYEPEVAYEPEGTYFEQAEPKAEPYALEAAAQYEQAGSYQVAPVAANDHDSFDAAFAASMEDELALNGDWSHAEPVAEDAFPQDAAAAYQPAFEPEYQSAAYDGVDYAAEPRASEPEFEATSLEDDFAAHGEWQSADQLAQFTIEQGAPAYEPVAYAEPAYEPAAHVEQPFDVAADNVEDHFADDFATALAEVDMDFTASPLASSGGPTFEPHVDIDDALVQHLQHDEAPLHAVAQVSPGLSLEDELNALLGNMSAPYAPAVQPVAAAEPTPLFDEPVFAEAATYEPQAETFDAPAYEAEAVEEFDLGLADDDFLLEDLSAPVAEPPFAQARSDHSYARGNYRIQPAGHEDAGEGFYPAETTSYGAPVEAYEAPAEPVAYASEPEFAPAAEAALDLDFDDDAFDAAFANSIEEADPVAYADEPVVYADEPDAVDQTHAEAESDPYAELAALTKSFAPETAAAHSMNLALNQAWDQGPVAEPMPQTSAQYEQSDDRNDFASPGFDNYPDIETVDVPEQAVALADDLDLPELSYEEDVPAAAYDDIDAEFASLLNDMNSPEPTAPEPAMPLAAGMEDFAADFEREFQLEDQAYQSGSYAYPAAAAAGAVAAASAFGTTAPRSAYAQPITAATSDVVFGAAPHAQHQPASELDYDPDFDDEMALPAYGAAEERERPQRRGALIAAIIGGVVVLGGVGAFALSGGSSGSGAPAVIKADDGPIKVRPENPGGTTVPNQDNKVYETVARTPSNEPAQQRLVTTAETPIDMTAQEAPVDSEEPFVGDDDVVAAGKSEDRIQQAIQDDAATQNTEVAAVAPRKVRTMIVRADGTLVPREEPAPVATAPALAPVPAVTPAAAPSVMSPAAPAPKAAAPAAPAVAAEPVPAEAAAPKAAATKPLVSTTPSSVAVAPTRPSDQPVDVVGEVKPDQVAAVSANAAPAGDWAMQIASQPNEAAAQSSYQDLLRRYGNVLNGHPANIVKAEIAGKGTFWRVRVPAATRNDAITLCESYKAAGGNCFVSK